MFILCSSYFVLTFFQTFWVSGSCPYGKRCCFIHTELPAPGAPPAAPAGNSPPANPQNAESNASSGTTGATRGRSQSVTSDPTDAPQVSLLTRIQNQRTADAQAVVNANANPNMATPTEGGSTPTFQFPQQRPSSLRVDTATIDTQLSMKQNKSAYPYMNNSIPKNGEHMSLISPGPVTAGPDLGRGASRFDAYEVSPPRRNYFISNVNLFPFSGLTRCKPPPPLSLLLPSNKAPGQIPSATPSMAPSR